jgi:hypothetical protein
MIAAAQYGSAAENRAAADQIRKRLFQGAKPKLVAIAERKAPIIPEGMQTHTSFTIDVSGDYTLCEPPTLIVEDDRDRRTIRQIVMEELKRYPRVTLEQIRGPSLRRHVSDARQRIMYSIKKVQPWRSLSEIGRFFNRGHTTVLTAVTKMAAIIDGDEVSKVKHQAKRERDKKAALRVNARRKAKQNGAPA